MEYKNYKPNYIDETVIDLFDEFPEDFWDSKDLYIYKLVKRHVEYKNLCIFGYILWPLAVFWMPPIIGIILDTIRYFYIGIFIYENSPIISILLFSLTTPVTLPIFILFGFAINPIILKKIMLSKKYLYSDTIMQAIRFSKSERNKISAGALAGTIFGKYTMHQ